MDKPDLPENFKAVEHPMEDVLDIETGSTEFPMVEERDTKAIVPHGYDDADTEITEQFQEVYNTAMDAYEQQAADIESVPPQFRARNQEVAVQYLNTALSAAKEKAGMKMTKDKNIVKEKTGSGPQTLNQSVILADRNDILKKLFENKESE